MQSAGHFICTSCYHLCNVELIRMHARTRRNRRGSIQSTDANDKVGRRRRCLSDDGRKGDSTSPAPPPQRSATKDEFGRFVQRKHNRQLHGIITLSIDDDGRPRGFCVEQRARMLHSQVNPIDRMLECCCCSMSFPCSISRVSHALNVSYGQCACI